MTLSKIKTYLQYGGLTKEQHDEILTEVVSANRVVITIASCIYALVIAFYMSFYVLYNTSSEILIADSVWLISALVLILASRVSKPNVSNIVTGIFIVYSHLLMLYFTFIHPERPATLFLISIVFIPICLMIVPLTTLLFTVPFSILFIATSPLYRTFEFQGAEQVECFLFTIVSMVFSFYISYLRGKQIWLTRENSQLANRDVLTGLYNRTRYQSVVNYFLKDPIPGNMTVVYIDVNGLHELNNSKGHTEGDKMLMLVAQCLKKHFGDGHTFRIGGDEFVCFSIASYEHESYEKICAIKEEIEPYGYHISTGIASSVPEKSFLTDIILEAERRMYEDKKNFYLSSGHERRARMKDE